MTSKKVEKKGLTVDEAQRFLVEEAERNRQLCLQELDVVLRKWGFRLEIARDIILVPARR